MYSLPLTPWLRRALCGLALTALACGSLGGWWPLPFVDGLDRQVYDTRLRWSPPIAAERVVIVDVDERSLAEIGRWPWSRSVVGELADRLAGQGHASVIGFDILFAETQTGGGDDAALAEVLARTPTVLGYYLSSDREGRVSGQLPAPVLDGAVVRDLGLTITDWSGYGANLSVLQSAARGAGFFNAVIDPDGVVRMLPLLGRFGDQVHESFAVAVLRQHLGAAGLILRSDSLQLQGSRGKVSLPLSDGLGALVPFSGRRGGAAAAGNAGSGNFRTVSAARVLNGDVDWKVFEGRVVLIGTSAPGLTDLRATPISQTAPGVEIHATLIETALRDAAAAPGPVADAVSSSAIRQRSQDARSSALVVAALAGVVLSFAMPALGAAGVLLLGGVGAAALVAWDMFAFWSLGWVMPMAAGLVLVAVLTALNLALGYLIEGRARRAVSDLFGAYVSPALVERMTRDPMRFRTMTSENRELTIMFADIRGFTRIAESMEPGALREFINEFLTVMTEVIHRHHGTVDKYIGDAVMAFWGAPVEDPAHADQAVSAALAMAAEVQRLNVDFARRGWPTLAMGVGLNTGVARVGDMGSRLRRAYTVLGDAVNLASRIEALTKQFNTPIIVGESTARHARSHRFTELAQVNVAGRNEAVRVFVPVVMADSRQPIEPRPGQRVSPTRDRHDEVSSTGV